MEEDLLVVESKPTESTASAQTKLFTNDEVDAIVKRKKIEAADRARRDAEAQYAAEIEKLKASQNQQMGGMPQGSNSSVDDIYNQVRERLLEETRKEAYESEMKQIADTYFNKMSGGASLYDDFNEVMEDFQPTSFPQVVYLASQVDNTPQVMYELAKNPQKLAAIHSLALADPKQARKALKQLSDSITVNEEAKNEYVPTNRPLSKHNPSHMGTDKGEMSLSDFKNASWLKT